MDKKDLISVIVPVYNVKQYLAQCIRSILSQSYPNFELILVDDGSTDGSGELCERFALKDDRIKVIHKENGGLSSARNSGLEIAEGEWISFVDSDDYIGQDMLLALLESCVDNGVEVGVAGFRTFADGTNQVIRQYCPEKEETVPAVKFIEMMTFEQGPMFSAWNKLYNKRLWLNHRFPLGRNWEDIATIHKVVDETTRVILINHVFYFYRARNGSISRPRDSARKYSDFEKSMREFLIWAYKNHSELIGAAEKQYIEALLYIVSEAAIFRDSEYYDLISRKISYFRKRMLFHPDLKRSDSFKLCLINCRLFYNTYPLIEICLRHLRKIVKHR